MSIITSANYANVTPVAADYALGVQASGPLVKTFLFSDSRLFMTAAFGGQTNAISAAATAVIDKLNVCTATSANYTVTLPAVATNAGKLLGVLIDASSTKLVTIDGNSTEAIDSEATRVMWAGEAAVLYCDGSNWFKVAGKSKPMYCTMIHSSGVQTCNNTTSTKVPINTSIVDNTGLMADTTNKRINILRKSTYTIALSTVFSNNLSTGALGANSTRTLTQIYASVNGASSAQIGTAEGYGVSGGFPAYTAYANIFLYVNDYAEAYGYQNSGAQQGFYYGNPGGSQLFVTEVPQW